MRMQPLGTGGSGRVVYVGRGGVVGGDDGGGVGVGEVCGDNVRLRGSGEATLSGGFTGDILQRSAVSTLGVGRATFGV